MIIAYYDFVNQSCTFECMTVKTSDESIVLASDSATCASDDILLAYQQFGMDCVNHLTGAFSFVLFDSRLKQLFVVRDKLGERTMYYSQLPTGIMFSTDLRALFSCVKYPAIRWHELAQPIRFNYPIELQHTWIEQIMRLRAGEYATVDKDGLRLHTYFRRSHAVTFTGSKNEAIQESLRLMRQSVNRCIQMSPGPVAVMLSGGIDSSSLAAFAKGIQNEVHVITAGYKGNTYTACDERQVARRFAEEQGFIYHEVELEVEDFQNLLNEFVPYLDEPCFDVSSMSQYAVYKKAAELGFKTILSGLGGDEQFYSYKGAHKIVDAAKNRREFVELYPYKRNKTKWLAYILGHFKDLLLPTQTACLSDMNPEMWVYGDYNRFATTAQMEFNDETIRFKDIDITHHFPDSTDIHSMYDYLFSTFATTLCVYLGNKLCAANGIEIRYPLLDSDLVTFLDGLPLEMKFDPSCPKKFQKEIMSGIVPDYILYARKRGFEPPFDFIRKMCGSYKYRVMNSDHVFFNSMVADMILSNMGFLNNKI